MQTASIPTIHYTDFFNGEKQQKWESVKMSSPQWKSP